MKSRSRNSRAIGSNTRVPRGFPSLLIITAALSSKRIDIPFSRCTVCAVRTTTARTTSDFLLAYLVKLLSQQQGLRHQYFHIARFNTRIHMLTCTHYYRQPQDKFVVESWELNSH